jgi:hypothetical protein
LKPAGRRQPAAVNLHRVPDSDIDGLRLGLEHARAWQQLHAEQRLRAVDFFLVATAFLVAAFVTSVTTSPGIALAVAVIGTCVALMFNRMELRTKELVKRGEAALRPLEAKLAGHLDIPELELVERSDRAGRRLTSYGQVIALLQWSAIVGFAIAAAFAVSRLAATL